MRNEECVVDFLKSLPYVINKGSHCTCSETVMLGSYVVGGVVSGPWFQSAA